MQEYARGKIVTVSACVLIVCSCVMKPTNPRLERKYGTFFEAPEGRITFDIMDNQGTVRPLMFFLDRCLAYPGESVTPLVVEVAFDYDGLAGSVDLQQELMTIQKELEIVVYDSAGRRYKVVPPEHVGKTNMLYGLDGWGQVQLNSPEYRLNMKVRLAHKGKVYTAERSFTCRRGPQGTPPMRADLDTPRTGWRE